MTDLTTLERAQKALSAVTNEQALRELAEKYKDLTKVKDTTDLKFAMSALSELRNTRLAITKAGKSARDDANAFAKSVIEEEKRLIGIIQPEEDRIKSAREDYEAEQAKIKAEKERIERERVAAIAKRIADFERGCAPVMPSADIRARIAELDAIEIDESFAELSEQAEAALLQAKKAANEALTASIEREKQEAEAEAKRQAEQEARRIESERLEQQRQEQERQAAELRKQQEEIERQRQAEQAKIDAERRELEEQQRKIEQARLIEQERQAERERLEAQHKAEQERQKQVQAEQARLAAMTLQERIGVWAKTHGIEQSALNELMEILETHAAIKQEYA